MRRLRRKINKRRRNLYLLIILVLLFMGTGYASLRTTVSISGNTAIEGNTWNVFLGNVQPTGNNTLTPFVSPTITGNTDLNFNIEFEDPQTVYEFYVTLYNQGTLDAEISTVNVVTPTTLENWSNYIEYSVTYEDGSDISVGDKLPHNTSKLIKVRAKYKVSSYEYLLHNDYDLVFGLSIKFVQDI